MKQVFFQTSVLTRVFIFLVIVHAGLSAKPGQKKEVKYGRASLTLFQGKVRHEIKGENCPVGVSFVRPERFSCACVNGVWAFYDVMCAQPLAIIGGHNYCFQMPDKYIQQVAIISNPLRPLEDSLAIFEGEKESIRTKVYRNLHIPLEGVDNFLALNSSWTIQQTGKKEGICLNSHLITEVQDPNFIQSMYCNFENISQFAPTIGSILKGCNESSTKIDPVDCQPLMAPNSEAVCSTPSVLEAYSKIVEVEDNDAESGNRSVRSFQRKWKHTTTTEPPITTTMTPTTTKITTTTTIKTTTTTQTTTPSTTTTTPTTTVKSPVGRRALNRKRGRNMDKNNTLTTTTSTTLPPETAPPRKEGDALLTSDEMIALMKQEWDNKENFLVPPNVDSNEAVLDQLWKYEKLNIQSSLGLAETLQSRRSRASPMISLIQISKQIMAKICPIVSAEYFNLALETFLSAQKKNFHWKEPYVAYNDYLRIYSSLTACNDRAKAFDFVTTKPCINKNPQQLMLGKGTENETQVNINTLIPNAFKSKGFEPIIETIWKIVVSTHSYCFKDFDEYYNDHHMYTTILMPSFLNDVHKAWMSHCHNKDIQEYAGFMGSTDSILEDIDKCATATRLISSYPFDLARPALEEDADGNGKAVPSCDATTGKSKRSPSNKATPSVSRKKRSSMELQHSENKQEEESPISLQEGHYKKNKIERKRRDISASNKKTRKDKAGGSSKPSSASQGKNSLESKMAAWKKSRLSLNGLGYCLKKYDEPRKYLDQKCEL